MEPVVTRRRLLAATGVATAGLAGCLGDGDSEEDPEPEGEPIDSLPSPREGPEDAPVTMTVYVDFSCPHCHDFKREVIPDIREEYVEPGDVAYLHGDLPLPVDDWSRPAAMAARAVQSEAGGEAFWEYSEALFDNQGDLEYDLLASLADDLEADVDGETIETMTREERTWPVVEADAETAEEHGVEGTPGVVVGDEYVPLESFDTAAETIGDEIDAQL